MYVVSFRFSYVDNSGNLLSAASREKNPDISVLWHFDFHNETGALWEFRVAQWCSILTSGHRYKLLKVLLS